MLETNRIGHLAPDLPEHLLEELGFNWNSSEAFIVVSKETVRLLRNTQPILIRQGKISKRNFPEAFLPVFPNGWADVAEREGFELPWETEHK